MTHDLSIVWLRRDLRIEDNSALTHACSVSKKVIVLFVFDSEILKRLSSIEDQRVTFIFDSIADLDQQLQQMGSRLVVLAGNPAIEIPQFTKQVNADALYFNEDYEPYAKLRDSCVQDHLENAGVKCFKLKDHVIFAGNEISKSDGSAYQMFTPYKNAWLKMLKSSDYRMQSIDHSKFISSQRSLASKPNPTLKDLGFVRSQKFSAPKAGRSAAVRALQAWSEHLDTYDSTRNFPADDHGTSGLSVYLRFGTLSIRECVWLARSKSSVGADTWLTELIWRDFYQMILQRFGHVVDGSFKKEYDSIIWLGKDVHFKAWCDGVTGVPIVDAGMRQLNQTGWMHNRLRMITASFLVKDLLVNWQKGEAYFAEKLLDFDLASNNGGWQWCASTGCDAQPYFRIFNPVLQSQKFDPECEFIKKWVPELRSLSAKEIHLLALREPGQPNSDYEHPQQYPMPIVSHKVQKALVLNMYQKGIK